jgi:hypothetical protein
MAGCTNWGGSVEEWVLHEPGHEIETNSHCHAHAFLPAEKTQGTNYDGGSSVPEPTWTQYKMYNSVPIRTDN